MKQLTELLQSRLGEVDEIVHNLKKRNASLETELKEKEDLKERNAGLEAKLREKERIVHNLKERNASLEAELKEKDRTTANLSQVWLLVSFNCST